MRQAFVDVCVAGTFVLTAVLVWQGLREPPSLRGAATLTSAAILMLFAALWNYRGLRSRFLLRRSPFKPTTVCLQHRINATERYYEAAFRSGKDVLYVSVMSEGTLKSMEPRLTDGLRLRTTVRVLTWAADTPEDTIEAYRLHLNENKDDPQISVQQARRAAQGWRNIQSRFSNVQVREYRSLPQMQGLIVKDSWAIIELIPFHTHPNDRPALILTPKGNPELFRLFTEKWEELWETNPMTKM